MRNTTAEQHRALEAAEAADGRLAQDIEKEVSFLDKLDRSIAQRGDDLHKLIDDTFRTVAAEMAVLRDAKLKTIADLRGTSAAAPGWAAGIPVTTSVPLMKPISEEDPRA